MKKTFFVQETKNKIYPIIVQSLDKSRLDEYIFEVADTLHNLPFKGNIIIDMLTSNGFRDRFFSIYYNGNSFEYSTIKSLKEIPRTILKKSNNFYCSNKVILKNSVLSKSQKLRYSKCDDEELCSCD